MVLRFLKQGPIGHVSQSEIRKRGFQKTMKLRLSCINYLYYTLGHRYSAAPHIGPKNMDLAERYETFSDILKCIRDQIAKTLKPGHRKIKNALELRLRIP